MSILEFMKMYFLADLAKAGVALGVIVGVFVLGIVIALIRICFEHVVSKFSNKR